MEERYEDGPTEEQIRVIAEELVEEFGGAVPPHTVRQWVGETLASFSGSRVRSFVPILARRRVRDRLRRHVSASS